MSTETEILELKKRTRNLEEVVKKLLTLYSNFVSNEQIQELIAAISDELSTNSNDIVDIKNRLDILEDIPDIDL